MNRPTPEQWRKIFQDSETGPPSEERFLPLASRKGLTSGEHFARYLFASAFCEGKRVLDVACGSGYGAYMLKIVGAAEVVGVDADPAAIETARRVYETPGLEFRIADATAIHPPERPFDVVVSFETIEHVADAEAFLESVRRQLAPGGLFLISCPHDARSPWVSPCHVRHFTYPEFRDLVARYFPDPVPVSQIHAIASLILPPE
ncbi:MAG: class I SAM-dependent methyltransferase, partial [Acidobacteria bacterium]|nr:class I SAM-dependent methyltransferase [Acidobacteriota bacterium]